MIRVIIEGPQGAGKTALASLLNNHLEEIGVPCVYVDADEHLPERAFTIVKSVSKWHDIEISTRQPADPITCSINVEMGDVDPDAVADMVMRSIKVALTPSRKPTFWEKVKGYFR